MPDIEDRTVGIPWYVLANQASANPRNEDTFWQVLRICEISALPYHKFHQYTRYLSPDFVGNQMNGRRRTTFDHIFNSGSRVADRIH